jgi:hypothetical protein
MRNKTVILDFCQCIFLEVKNEDQAQHKNNDEYMFTGGVGFGITADECL